MKKILLVIIVFLCVIIPHNVFALEDSFYDAEYIPGAYIVKIKDGSGKYEQMKVFRRRSDNRPVYCLQIWEGLNTNKNLNGYTNKQYSYANLNFETWVNVNFISYYGYGYKDHTDIKWYAATQYMIWKLTSPDSTIYFTDKLNGNRFDDKFKDEIEEINNLVKNHYVIPSFEASRNILKYKTPITLTDTNNVLDEFEIVGKGKLNVLIDGNQMTVSLDKISKEQVYLGKFDKIYSGPPVVYIDDIGQNLLAPGSFDPVYSVSFYYLYGGNLTINKYDSKTGVAQGDATLEKCVFQIIDEDGVVVDEVETDNNGKIFINDIGYGDYKLKEISSSNGYKINNNIIDFTISNEENSIDFYNEVIKNEIIINKYTVDYYGNSTKEAKAKFQVIDSRGNLYKEVITDSNGSISITLPYGKYLVKQISGTKNYRLVDDFNIDVLEDGKTQTFDLYNNIYTNKITINKYLKNKIYNRVEMESGAKFQIIDKNGNLFKEFETDNNGYYEIYLPVGSYIVKQISGKENYKLVDDFKITVSKDNEEKHYDLYNEIYINKIIINKYIRDCISGDTSIEVGAKFIVLDNDSNLIKEFSTNKNGNYELELPIGEYTIKQLSGIKNYKFVDDIKVSVIEDGKVQIFDLYNDQICISLNIKNLDNDTLLPILGNDTKYIINDKINNKNYELISNDGYTDSIKLTSGEYSINQISINSNYYLNEEEIDLIIDESKYSYNQNIELEINNSKKRGIIDINKKTEYYYNDVLEKEEYDDNYMLPLYAKNDIYSNGEMLYEKDYEITEIDTNNNYLVNIGDYYIKDEYNDQIIDISIIDDDSKVVSLLEKVFEYDDYLVIDVPNTYINDLDISNIYIYILYFGLSIMFLVNEYEKSKDI